MEARGGRGVLGVRRRGVRREVVVVVMMRERVLLGSGEWGGSGW